MTFDEWYDDEFASPTMHTERFACEAGWNASAVRYDKLLGACEKMATSLGSRQSMSEVESDFIDTLKVAELIEACEELLDDYWCEIDAAGGEKIRRRTMKALKAVTDGV